MEKRNHGRRQSGRAGLLTPWSMTAPAKSFGSHPSTTGLWEQLMTCKTVSVEAANVKGSQSLLLINTYIMAICQGSGGILHLMNPGRQQGPLPGTEGKNPQSSRFQVPRQLRFRS